MLRLGLLSIALDAVQQKLGSEAAPNVSVG